MFGSRFRHKFKPISKANDGSMNSSTRRGAAAPQNVEVIDDDLGRSASGLTARPGFDRLVARLCAERSEPLVFRRFPARPNGRDWHHLLKRAGWSRRG